LASAAAERVDAGAPDVCPLRHGRTSAPQPAAARWLRFTPLSALPPSVFSQLPGKAARMEELRAAVNAAGASLPPAARAACVAQAVEQFQRNNAVVREFPLPMSRVPAALARAAAAARAQLLALLVAALAAWAALRWRGAARA
jgi:hypothetical protein